MTMRKNRNSIKHADTTGKSGTLKSRKVEYFKMLVRLGWREYAAKERAGLV